MNPTKRAKREAQRAAQARINGANSKGPVSLEGKAVSSRNALKHGFAAKVNVLIGPDDSDAWQTHLTGCRDSYRPIDYVESAFVDQLASIAWRQSRLVSIETSLIDFQLAIQCEKVEQFHPLEKDNPNFHLALAWQGLARKAFPRLLPADPSIAVDPSIPPDGLDVDSIELARRYQVSLDRLFRNTMLSFRQYRKDFANPAEPNKPASAPITPANQESIQSFQSHPQTPKMSLPPVQENIISQTD